MRSAYLYFLSILCCQLCRSVAIAQVSLPANTIVTQHFNSLGSSATAAFPSNWKASAPGAGITAGWNSAGNLAQSSQAASSGLPSTGGIYNWATSAGTDRALGFLTTASYASPNALMAYYRNTNGGSVSSVTVAYSIERYVVNATVPTVDLYYSTDGSSWTALPAHSTTAADFPSGAAAGSFASPRTITRMATININLASNADIYLKWVFITSNTNSQGLGLDQVSIFAGAATPVVIATLQDILQVDNGIPNQYNEGDVIRYKTVVKNVGSGDAGNVQVTLPAPPAGTTMVSGSIRTSAMAINDAYSASFATMLSVGSVSAGVLANDVGIPLPTAVLSYGPTANAAASAPGAAITTDAGGSATLQANGTFTYTPPSGFAGVDRFSYITGNGNLPNNDAVATITVSADITFSTTLVHPVCNGGSSGSISFSASGGNGALQYSITGAAGTFQASNVFTGLPAGTYNLAVRDAGGLTRTATVTLNDPPAITINGTSPLNLVYNTSMATVTYSRVNGTGASTWSSTGLPQGLSLNASTGALTGTPTVTGVFTATINVTDAAGCLGSRNITVNVAPKLSNDSYTAVGNTQLVADGHTSPSTPFTGSITNILGNDQSDASLAVTAVNEAATTGGGTITIDAAGKFTYSPPNGSTTADSYTYTATSNGVSATATINFSLMGMIWYVNNTYAGANGSANGSSHRPYTELTATTAAAQANQIIYVHRGTGSTTGNAGLKTGQTLRGAGSALSIGALNLPAAIKPILSGTVTLASSVTVDGFDMNTGTATAFTNAGIAVTGVSVNVGSVTTSTGAGLTVTGSGNNVNISLQSLNTSGAANAVNLTGTAGSVSIGGGTITGGAGAPISITGGTVSLTFSGSVTQATAAQPLLNVSGGHVTGTILFQTGNLSATNGTGLQFDNADGIYTFNGSTTLNGGDAGIDITNGSGGTFTFNANTGITNPSGQLIRMDAGAANLTFSGSFSKTNNAATGISINGQTGGTIAINGTGTKILSTQTAAAISLTNNTGATISFSGNNLNITTSSGTGFAATGGGTLSISGTGNIITTTGGTGLQVANTFIGAGALTFQSITSAGGTGTGIILDNTGIGAGNGGLTITGDGVNTAVGGNGSGGTLSGKSGADGSVTTGIGIYLNNTRNVVLRRVTINGTNQNFGIRGLGVVNLTMEYCTVAGTNGNNDAFDEGAVYLGTDGIANGLTGTGTITSCSFSGGLEDNFHLALISGSLDRISFTGCNFGHNSTALGGDALFLQSDITATLRATVNNCTFTGSRGDIFQFSVRGTSVADLIFNGNTITNSHPNIVSGGGGITLGSGGSGAGYNPTFTYSITNNTQTGAVGSAMAIGKGGVGAGSFTGTISGNTIGNPAVGNSGSAQGSCIVADIIGAGSHTINVLNNNLYQFTNYGVWIQSGTNTTGGGQGYLTATIRGNTIANPSPASATALFPTGGIRVVTGTTSGDNSKNCITIGGTAAAEKNTINNTGTNGGTDLRLFQRFVTLLGIPGYAGANNDNAAMQTFLTGRNNLTTVLSSNNTATPGPGYSGTCPN